MALIPNPLRGPHIVPSFIARVSWWVGRGFVIGLWNRLLKEVPPHVSGRKRKEDEGKMVPLKWKKWVWCNAMEKVYLSLSLSFSVSSFLCFVLVCPSKISFSLFSGLRNGHFPEAEPPNQKLKNDGDNDWPISELRKATVSWAVWPKIQNLMHTKNDIAQWIRLHLPSCRPAYHLSSYQFIFELCNVEKTKKAKKRPGLAIKKERRMTRS